MVAFSSLRAAVSGSKSLFSPSRRELLNILNKPNGISAPARQMGGGNKMLLKPSNYEWTEWKDRLHFYIMLGVVPMALLITTVNVFIGRAELADIPEGYEPKHWEYHQHPISRWLAQYMYDNPQKDYEKYLHKVNYENEKRKLRLLEKRVKELMAERGDYKGWYYVPTNERKVYLARQLHDDRSYNDGAIR